MPCGHGEKVTKRKIVKGNGADLNLQEITLGYTFDKLSFMRNFNIYVNVKNPFYLWRADKDIDPQAPNYDISAYRTYVVGFNINF